MYCFVLSFRSLTSEFITPSGSPHIFRFRLRFISSKPNQKLLVSIGGVDMKPRVRAPRLIDDEVGKRFVEGPNGLIMIVLLEGEERVD